MLVCERGLVADVDQLIAHPSLLVREKNPDRALSSDYEIVSDLRQINSGIDKSDSHPWKLRG